MPPLPPRAYSTIWQSNGPTGQRSLKRHDTHSSPSDGSNRWHHRPSVGSFITRLHNLERTSGSQWLYHQEMREILHFVHPGWSEAQIQPLAVQLEPPNSPSHCLLTVVALQMWKQQISLDWIYYSDRIPNKSNINCQFRLKGETQQQAWWQLE